MKLKPHEFVLMVLWGSGGDIAGRTLLQKRCYFVAVLVAQDQPEAMGYQAHYYGPYSQVIADALGALRSAGFVTEEACGFGVPDCAGFEVTRYDYGLTEQGKRIAERLKSEHGKDCQSIEEACTTLTAAGELDYVALSVAAKAYHVLRLQGRPMTYEDICTEARRYSWTISGAQAERAAEFLERMGLVECKTA